MGEGLFLDRPTSLRFTSGLYVHQSNTDVQPDFLSMTCNAWLPVSALPQQDASASAPHLSKIVQNKVHGESECCVFASYSQLLGLVRRLLVSKIYFHSV
jgi:hypothetical protein